jgi:hypothetical protein
MIRYPVEKYILRFYKYKFYQSDEIVTIEAFNRKQARIFLRDFILKNPKLQNIPIISESLTLPIFGQTTKIIDGVENVWIGNGWIPLWEFKKYENE